MKKIPNYFRSLMTLSLLLLFAHLAPGQSYADSLAQDDREIISSIAPYPAEVRSAILNVSQYPQILVKLERIQARSSQSFQDLIAGYPREEQEKFYEMVRFPDLMNKMATGTSNSEDVKGSLKDLPAETQNRMMDVYNNHHGDMLKINEMFQASQKTLQEIISSYPENVKNDFRKVISMPDVMSLLTDNIDLTVSLGEDYKANPDGLVRELDTMNAKITAQNEKDLEDYKKDVATDPKLQSEMKSAASDFSASYDYPDNPNYVANNYYDNYPYPYWFSYPYWYPTPIWYPRPIYYHTGFYYGAGGAMVVVGLPSMYYSSWFFGRGYRHYPLLYGRYNTYYNLHRAGYGNAYRGFYHEAGRHFSNVNRSGNSYNRGRSGGSTNYSRSANGNVSHSTSRTYNSSAVRNARVGQMHVQPNNFNRSGLSQYHATQYHNTGWGHVSGGSRGLSSLGASRSSSFGGGARSGGGGSRGGGGGGRRGR